MSMCTGGVVGEGAGGAPGRIALRVRRWTTLWERGCTMTLTVLSGFRLRVGGGVLVGLSAPLGEVQRSPSGERGRGGNKEEIGGTGELRRGKGVLEREGGVEGGGGISEVMGRVMMGEGSLVLQRVRGVGGR